MTELSKNEQEFDKVSISSDRSDVEVIELGVQVPGGFPRGDQVFSFEPDEFAVFMRRMGSPHFLQAPQGIGTDVASFRTRTRAFSDTPRCGVEGGALDW